MVNTVFGGATSQIVYKQVYIEDDPNTTNTSAGSNVNPQSQSLSINKFIKDFIDLLNKVYLGETKEYFEFDRLFQIIFKYLYDSFITDNSATYSILKNNVSKVFKALLEEMEYIVFKNGDLYFLEGTIIASLLPFLTNYIQGENDNADLLELVKFNIEVFLDKLEENDVDPFDDFKRKVVQFDKLERLVLNSLETYLALFKDGDFSTLSEQFNEDEQNAIGSMLTSDTLFVITEREILEYQDTNQLFDAYKSFIFKIIDGLNSSILLNKQNNNVSALNTSLVQFRDILQTPDLLNIYIRENYQSLRTFLMDFKVTAPKLTIKVEYAEYIKIYGVPESGVFDAEKLANIRKDLGLN
jgi:hypothetical protein